MLSRGHEHLNREIGLLLAYNPPPLTAHPESPCPKLTAPLSFYHRHLGERLVLKRVKLVPSITKDLSDLVDRSLQCVSDNKTRLLTSEDDFPSFGEHHRRQNPLIDARAIAEVYQLDTASSCEELASMLSLHPNVTRWSCILAFNQIQIGRQQQYYALDEGFSLTFHLDYDGILIVPDAILDSLDSAAREDLKQLSQRFPRLAVWQFYFISQEAEDVLKTLDIIASQPVFKHEQHNTVGFKSPTHAVLRFPDALRALPGIPTSSLPARSETSGPTRLEAEARTIPTRRSTRIMAKGHAKPRNGDSKKLLRAVKPSIKVQPGEQARQWTDVTLPSRNNSTTSEGPEELTASLIQHAWFRAVEKDSSFIILHCGNFERIGFRQRSTQTLYISELIDVPRCTNPAYGKLHVGLHTSIVDDALDRSRQLLNLEKDMGPKTRKKRGRNAVDAPEFRKRPKTRAFIAKEAASNRQRLNTHKAVVQEISSRSLALLRIQYAHFNSPSPASFLRVDAARQPSYTPKEYFTLTITSEIGGGATGDVHAATLELLPSSGEVLQVEVVVKIAFDDAQQKRMQHEYAVYKHLMHSNVKGIPHIFGLFKDVETRALALVMDHVGLSVWERRPDKKSTDFIISDSEGAAFIGALRDIHRTGVRHRDLRPENPAVNDNGIVSIIDFDQAELNASEGSRERELKHLMALINGDYTPPGDVDSLRTPGRSRSPSGSGAGSNHSHSYVSSTSVSSLS